MIVQATPNQIDAAARLIRDGGVVAFPTETVYGLGADATNARAVARIFEIKARPSFDPLIVHIEPEWWRDLVGSIPPHAMELAQRFWPGPLTIVLPKTDRIPDIVTAGLDSVAARVPAHPVARALLAAAQTPIAAPSANPFGYVSPTTAEHVTSQIGDLVPLTLDGGPCHVGIESTVISFVDTQPTLLRPGGIPLEQIEALIGAVAVRTSSEQPIAPGQLPRHYAPRTPLTIVADIATVPLDVRRDAALLTVFPIANVSGFRHVEILAADGDLTTAAANLFAALRRLDASGYGRIFATTVPERGLGRAISDRLRRAAARADA
jgi:L-threonylcarbamoyladenylate synthase